MGTIGTIVNGVKSILSARAVARALSPLTRSRLTVFALHRVADPVFGIGGHSLTGLRRLLARLRRDRWMVLDLEAGLDRLRDEPRTLKRALAFTLDDGYADVCSVASVFAEFDCPLTVFVATGFLDGTTWMWWDKIRYMIESTDLHSLRLDTELHDGPLELSNPITARRSVYRVVERCKRLDHRDKLAAIEGLAAATGVSPPDKPPPQYAPLTWHEARALEGGGVRFGPHTVTHPILSRTTDDHSDHEIRESWRRVEQELRNPVPVFAYPNGLARDFGLREMNSVRRASLKGALTMEPGYATPSVTPADPYRTPRFAHSANPSDAILTAAGLHRIADRVHRMMRRES